MIWLQNEVNEFLLLFLTNTRRPRKNHENLSKCQKT